MKRSILILLVIGTVMIFFGCSVDNPMAPNLNQNDPMAKELSQSDQVTTTLAKVKKVKRTFEGICTFVEPVPNTWYDAADDWRVTGTTIWIQPDEDFKGTATLIVDAKNPHDENRGIWEMEWTGNLTPTLEPVGMILVATATGVGVEGKVKGMKANWTYTMNYVGTDFPNPANQTFFYVIEGNIDKPQGPIKK